MRGHLTYVACQRLPKVACTSNEDTRYWWMIVGSHHAWMIIDSQHKDSTITPSLRHLMVDSCCVSGLHILFALARSGPEIKICLPQP